LRAIQDALAGVETARVVLARARQRIEDLAETDTETGSTANQQ